MANQESIAGAVVFKLTYSKNDIRLNRPRLILTKKKEGGSIRSVFMSELNNKYKVDEIESNMSSFKSILGSYLS